MSSFPEVCFPISSNARATCVSSPQWLQSKNIKTTEMIIFLCRNSSATSSASIRLSVLHCGRKGWVHLFLPLGWPIAQYSPANSWMQIDYSPKSLDLQTWSRFLSVWLCHIAKLGGVSAVTKLLVAPWPSFFSHPGSPSKPVPTKWTRVEIIHCNEIHLAFIRLAYGCSQPLPQKSTVSPLPARHENGGLCLPEAQSHALSDAAVGPCNHGKAATKVWYSRSSCSPTQLRSHRWECCLGQWREFMWIFPSFKTRQHAAVSCSCRIWNEHWWHRT